MSLTPEEKQKLLRLMLQSRHGDLREQSLIRQGKGMFHVSGMGHEALAAIGMQLREDDYVCPYYRDRGLVIARGMTNRDIALEFFAKKDAESAGRQMPGHYSFREKKIWSLPSPVAANLLPGCGMAWGMQMDGKDSVVVCSLGDAATRQGDFYEAGSFAKELDLPMLFLVEDNGIGISSVTEKTTPKGLRLIKEHAWVFLDGSDPEAVYKAGQEALAHIRAGNGPVFIWCRMERISSHSSADDQRKYRPAEELENLLQHCPIDRLKNKMIEAGELTEEGFETLRKEIENEVRSEYQQAFQEADPQKSDILANVHGPSKEAPAFDLDLGEQSRLVDAINGTFEKALSSSDDYIFFGQDIADPKGGVFSLTKGLSTAFPERVFNSPLAESTILGVAVGLASYGKKPIFEIQFIDFIWPGFNHFASNLSNLRWRSNGKWSAPCVIYAPYGAYLPGGAIWHSQTNEGVFGHFPGVKVCVPSTPEDAAGLFWSAMDDPDPVLVLIPKHLLWNQHPMHGPVKPVPLGKASLKREGNAVTLVCWGNCVEIAEEALAELGNSADVELIDLRTVSPWDEDTVIASVKKTGRLVVVQEDQEQSSIGGTIISRLSARNDIWDRLKAPPKLVTKPNVSIGYGNIYEYGALPDKDAVMAAVREVSAVSQERTGRSFSAPTGSSESTEKTTAPTVSPGKLMTRAFSDSASDSIDSTEERVINVPLLGEGITRAKVVSLMKQPGDTLEADESLCELETDKAIFPVETEFAGVLKEWHVEEEDDVDVGQKLLTIEVEIQHAPNRPQPATSPVEVAEPEPMATVEPERPREGGLSQTIINQLKNVVATHMTVKVPWGKIREARAEAKKRGEGDRVSPTVMIAWCVSRAMMNHPVFTCTINAQDSLTEHKEFDFGFAVSLENDALDTAVIPRAPQLEWPEFVDHYNRALKESRSRRFASKARTPLIITSMGGFSVRSALPVVVPPAIATLFIGEAHWEFGKSRDEMSEQVEMCLSFDHRWINGVAGAAFMADVRENMSSFVLPETE